jgi:hypothetical protein
MLKLAGGLAAAVALSCAAGPMWEAGELNYSDEEAEVSAFVNTEHNTQLQTVLCALNTGYSYRFTLLLPQAVNNDMVIQAGVKSDTLNSKVYAEASGNSLEFQIDQALIISLRDSPMLEFTFSKQDAALLGLPEKMSVPMTGSDLTMRKVASECTALCLTKDYSCDKPLISSILWPQSGFSKYPGQGDLEALCTDFKAGHFSFNNSSGCRFGLDRFYARHGVGPLSFLDEIFNREGSHFDRYVKLWNSAASQVQGAEPTDDVKADGREWYLSLYALSGAHKVRQLPQSYFDILKFDGDPTTFLYDTDNRYELEQLKYTSVLAKRYHSSFKASADFEEALKEWSEFYHEFCSALPQGREAQALRPLVYRTMLLRIWHLAGMPEGVILRSKNAFRQGINGRTVSGDYLESVCSFFDGEGGSEYFYASDQCVKGVFADLGGNGFKNAAFDDVVAKWDAFSKAWRDSVFFNDNVDDAVGTTPRAKLTLSLLSLYKIYGFGDYFLMRQCIASRDPDICSYENARYYRNYEQELANRLESISAVSSSDAAELGKANELWKRYYEALCSYVDSLELQGLVPAWRASLVKGMAAVQQTNALLNLSYDREELPDETLENVD